MKKTLALAAVAALLFTFATPVQADNIEDLQRTVRALENRIHQLEGANNSAEAATRAQVLDILEEMQLEQHPNDFRVYWKNGIHFDTADGNFKLQTGGSLQIDIGWIDAEEDELLKHNTKDGTEVRRARLFVKGTIYKDIYFKWQIDWQSGHVSVKDAFLRLMNIPVLGNVTMGHFFEPFSMEGQSSGLRLMFAEPALPIVLAPGRNVGIMASNQLFDKRMTWAIGMFRTTDGAGVVREDGTYAVTGRITGLPWYENEGRKLLHLGASFSHRRNSDDGISYSTEGEHHWDDIPFSSTGTFQARNSNLFGAELALVHGPFSVQAEFLANATSGTNDTSKLEGQDYTIDGDFNDPCFVGYYVAASYFLTPGDHRSYDPKTGVFGRITPQKNFREDGGWGAWEIAYRYSSIDFVEPNIPGKDVSTYRGDVANRLRNATIGLNWYLNPNTRITWNYIFSHADSRYVSAEASIFMMRMQIDF